MTLRLARRFTSVLAVDHSPGMLEVAARNLSRAGVSNVELQQGAIPSVLCTLKGSFDLVSAVGFLHHLTKDEIGELVLGALKLLCKGGTLIVVEPFDVSTPQPRSIEAWNSRSLAARLGYSVDAEDPDEAPLNEAALRSCLSTAGFAVVDEVQTWEIFNHSPHPGLFERIRIRFLYRRHFGQGNVIGLRLVAS